MVYGIAVIQMTLSDLQGHLPPANFSDGIIRTAVQQLTRFQLT